MNRDKSGGVFQARTLDIDDSILDRNLRILGLGDDSDPEVAGLPPSLRDPPLSMLSPDENLPSVSVSPKPGLCVKTKNVAGEKVFVNLCKIDQIPPAPHITEEKLKSIIQSEDYDTDFR